MTFSRFFGHFKNVHKNVQKTSNISSTIVNPKNRNCEHYALNAKKIILKNLLGVFQIVNTKIAKSQNVQKKSQKMFKNVENENVQKR